MTLIAASLVGAFTLAPLAASAVSSIVAARIENDKAGLEAKIDTASPITTDGTDGWFGYGILNVGDFDVRVATTHEGFYDSELQTELGAEATWHNHYAKLKVHEGAACEVTVLGVAVEVADLTFDSPGEVSVDGSSIKMEDLPPEFTGTSALSGDPLTVDPADAVDKAVSFTLRGAVDGDGLHVCVEDLAPTAASLD